MADSSVNITAGSGTSVDTFTQANGDHRQAVVLGDASASNTVSVRSDGTLNVNLGASADVVAPATGTFTNVANSAVTVDVNSAGNVTVALIGGSFTNLPIIFEASSDSQTSWFPIYGTQLDGTGMNSQYVVPSNTTGARAWNIGVPGFTHIRMRLTATATTFTTSPTIRVTQGAFLWQPGPTIAPIDGQKATYTSYVNNLASNFAGDFWALTGSATRTVRMIRLEVSLVVSGTITTGSNLLTLSKRTTANTGGTTSTAPSLGALDSADPTVSATSTTWSALPTAGTTASTVRAQRFTSAAQTYLWTWDFGNRPSRAPVVRGTAQQLVLTLANAFAGTTPVTAWNILAEFTEE